MAICLQGASSPEPSTVYVDLRALRNDRVSLVERGSPHSLCLMESGKLLPGVKVIIANPESKGTKVRDFLVFDCAPSSADRHQIHNTWLKVMCVSAIEMELFRTMRRLTFGRNLGAKRTQCQRLLHDTGGRI